MKKQIAFQQNLSKLDWVFKIMEEENEAQTSPKGVDRKWIETDWGIAGGNLFRSGVKV